MPSMTVNHRAGIMPVIDDDEEDDDDPSSGDASGDSPLLGADVDLSTLVGESVANDQSLRPGSSCHQCKSRRTNGQLSHCSGNNKRKSCRKKYCDQCLTKFYQMHSSRHKSYRDRKWSCPSCQGMCCCAACRRSKTKVARAPNGKTPEMYSPATSMAVGLVYFGDFDLLSGEALPSSTSDPKPSDDS